MITALERRKAEGLIGGDVATLTVAFGKRLPPYDPAWDEKVPERSALEQQMSKEAATIRDTLRHEAYMKERGMFLHDPHPQAPRGSSLPPNAGTVRAMQVWAGTARAWMDGWEGLGREGEDDGLAGGVLAVWIVSGQDWSCARPCIIERGDGQRTAVPLSAYDALCCCAPTLQIWRQQLEATGQHVSQSGSAPASPAYGGADRSSPAGTTGRGGGVGSSAQGGRLRHTSGSGRGASLSPSPNRTGGLAGTGAGAGGEGPYTSKDKLVLYTLRSGSDPLATGPAAATLTRPPPGACAAEGEN